MNCCIKSCNISDDRFLWKCEFCNKRYHAACAGVQRHQENHIQHYMIPLCEDCQHHLKAGIDTSKVLSQQEQLISSIKSQTDSNLRISADLKKFNAMGELFEHMELQLKEAVSAINNNTAIKVNNAVSSLSQGMETRQETKSCEFADVKNHLTMLFNISMEASRDRIENYVSVLTTDLDRELKRICDDVQNISTVTIDMAAHCTEHSSRLSRTAEEALNSIKSNVLTEVKSLGITICNLEDELKTFASNNTEAFKNTLPITPPDSHPSLELELNIANNANVQNADNSGWRLLGPRRIWKADWTDYDKREKHRLEQQKKANAARKRKNQRRKSYNNYNNNNYSNYNNNKDNSNNNSSNNYNNKNNINNNNNRNKNYKNRNINNNNYNNNNNNNYNQLPPDRELLAAAKDRFSRPPPAPRHRPIHFQRGEVLNPYPASDTSSSATPTVPTRSFNMMTPGTSSAVLYPYHLAGSSSANSPNTMNMTTSCEACACRHSCFARN